MPAGSLEGLLTRQLDRSDLISDNLAYLSEEEAAATMSRLAAAKEMSADIVVYIIGISWYFYIKRRKKTGTESFSLRPPIGSFMLFVILIYFFLLLPLFIILYFHSATKEQSMILLFNLPSFC